jgi:hypothetical protein
MLVELDSNWFSSDYGFNTKAHSWYGELLINLYVCDEWYKRIERIK